MIFDKKKFSHIMLKKQILFTRAVLSVLLVLRMKVVDSIGHNVPWVHCFLQNKNIYSNVRGGGKLRSNFPTERE
jgi:hypothetical protein